MKLSPPITESEFRIPWRPRPTKDVPAPGSQRSWPAGDNRTIPVAFAIRPLRAHIPADHRRFPQSGLGCGVLGKTFALVQMVGFRLFSTFFPILGASAILVRPFCRCPLAVSLSCGHCSDKAVEPLYTPLGLGIASTPSPSCLSSRKKVTLLRSLPLTTWKRGQTRCQLRMSLLPSAASRLGGTTRPSQHHQRRQHSSPFPRDGASPWC